MKRSAYLSVLAAAILWGTIGIFVNNLTAAGVSSDQAIFLRFSVAALGLFLYLLIRDRSLLRIRLRDLWMFLGAGGIGICLDNVFYFRSIAMTNMGVASMLMYTSPIFVMLLSTLFFRERITGRKLLALAITVAGCVFISDVFSSDGNAFPPLGVAFGVISGLAYAMYSIFAVFALRRYSPFTVTFYAFLTVAVCTLFYAHPWEIFTAHASWTVLWNALGLGLIAALFPFLLYTRGLAGMEASRASILCTIEPIAAILFGVVLFGDSISLYTGVGIVLIVAAILLLNLRTHVRRTA